MIQTEIREIAAMPRVFPVGYKKHHRWQWGWQKFRIVVQFIGKVWPKNQ